MQARASSVGRWVTTGFPMATAPWIAGGMLHLLLNSRLKSVMRILFVEPKNDLCFWQSSEVVWL